MPQTEFLDFIVTFEAQKPDVTSNALLTGATGCMKISVSAVPDL